MARETQKAKIERLEKDLKQANQIIQKLNNEIERLKKKRERKANENNLERIDQQLQDARDKADKWHKQLFIQQQKNKELEKEIEYLVEKNSIIQKHNERGAGRKNRFNEQEIETIKVMRLRGDKIKDIAEQFNCSVGLIHKLIHESEEK
ncbi:MAG: hypothetical protein KH421_11735 [Akkermansia muciniphila]|jgi:chromosome segregation ATPase|nr:hypothetical protein [Akkermansia muciniphila]